MDQLIQQIVQRTGISEAQARQAVEAVVGHLKGRLPAPLAGQLDKLIGVDGSPAGAKESGGGLPGGLGGLFGGK
ncbi:MAG: HU family DNA-binding protein [Gemmatimonadota bacterium]|nr:HU family DNA-binding protein [Gemmatimonadota bacterium]